MVIGICKKVTVAVLIYASVSFLNFYFYLYFKLLYYIILIFCLSVFLGPHLWHTEVPRLEVQSEL